MKDNIGKQLSMFNLDRPIVQPKERIVGGNKVVDYDEFLSKFEHKKTTDDCYTTKEIYNVILDYVGGIVDLSNRTIVRPFYPGGDYKSFDYKDDSIVIDNPPFSIYNEIVKFYEANNIDFFLFANGNTLCNTNHDVCYIIINCGITYENGANISTSFATNLIKDYRFICDGVLNDRLKRVNDVILKRKKLVKYNYDRHLTNSAKLKLIARNGCVTKIKKNECVIVPNLDSMTAIKAKPFGCAVVLGDAAANAIKNAEKCVKSISADCYDVNPSEREWNLIKQLD